MNSAYGYNQDDGLPPIDCYNPLNGPAPAYAVGLDGVPVSPRVAINTEIDALPDDYMVLGIVATLFFFFPTGLIAILRSAEVTNKWSKGNYHGAIKASQYARKYTYVSFAIGSLLWLVGLVMCIVYVLVLQPAGDS